MLVLGSILLAACSLVVTACGDDAEETSSSSSTPSTTAGGDAAALTVAVKPHQAAPGSTVQATVRNGTSKQFTYGAAYGLEHDVAGSFEMVKLPSTPVIEIGYVAPPGGAGPAVEVQLPADLAPGTYRVVLAEGVPGGPLTGQFEVSDGG